MYMKIFFLCGLWHKAALRAVPISPLLALRLHPSQGSSPAPCLVQGGLCHKTVHVPTQIQALQAMVISRLLEPERPAWKVFQLYHLSHWAMGPASCLARSTQPSGNCQLGCQLRGGLQGSSASPPSNSHCHAAIGCLKRATLLQQADLSACCQLSYNQHCLPSCCIPDSSAKAPYAFSGHY